MINTHHLATDQAYAQSEKVAKGKEKWRRRSNQKKLDIGPAHFFASLFEDLALLCANNQYQEYLVTHYLHGSPLVPPFSSKLRPTKLI
jgi:hypothetical protein